MKNISTENKSIILSSVITIILFCFIFCASNLFRKNNYINEIKTSMGNGDYLKLNLETNINDNTEKQKSKFTKKENTKKTNSKLKEESHYTSKFNNIDKQPNTTQDNTNKIPNLDDTINTNNNSSEANSGIGNFHFYSIGTAKILTEDILDKKITENLYYPEKAKRRGIEGKVSIQIDISKEGELISYKIISKKSNPILEEASIMTLKRIFPIDEFQIKNSEENFSTIITLLYKLN